MTNVLILVAILSTVGVLANGMWARSERLARLFLCACIFIAVGLMFLVGWLEPPQWACQ